MSDPTGESIPAEGPVGWTPPAGLDDTLQLETERLVIRLYTLDDAEALLASVESCRDTVGTWETWARSFHTIDDAHALIVRHRLGVRDLAVARSLELGVFDRATGRHVGGVGFHSLRPDTGEAEIGYWVRSDRAGQGLATEANGALVTRLLSPQSAGGLGLHRVCARCSAENPASRRVLERLGFALELHQPRAYFVRGLGRITDLLGYGVLREEWDTDGHRALDTTPAARLSPEQA